MLNHETIRTQSANKRSQRSPFSSIASERALKPRAGHLTLLFTRTRAGQKLDGHSAPDKRPGLCKFLGGLSGHLHRSRVLERRGRGGGWLYLARHRFLFRVDCPRLLRLNFSRSNLAHIRRADFNVIGCARGAGIMASERESSFRQPYSCERGSPGI